MPYLIFKEHGERKSVELLMERPLNIGRSKLNDICFVDNEKISRQHCSIFFEPNHGHFRIRDLGSTNGTFLNDRKLTEDVSLMDGDKMTVGDILITYKVESVSDTQKIIRIKPPQEKPLSVKNISEIELTQTVTEYEEKKLQTLFVKADLGAYTFGQGDMVDKQEVIRKLGESEHSAEYLVRGEGEEDIRAMKIFKIDLKENEEGLTAFYDNIQAAITQNPYYVLYYEAGVNSGCCFYTMDYMPNGNLQSRIANGAPFSEMQALYIVINTAIALNTEFLESKRTHLNLKPSNILYDADDNIKVSDYGLSLWMSKYLLNGVKPIAPWYISPEQVANHSPGWASDLYSLGVIFFQMLTGVLPFHALNDAEIYRMHVEDSFPSPAERNANVSISDKTISILERMTAKNPAERFDSWNLFLAEAQLQYDELFRIEEAKTSSERIDVKPMKSK